MPELFQIKEVTIQEWDIYWQRCPKANLLQCLQYGAAKAQSEGWRALKFLISDNADYPLALAQVLTRSLPLLGGIARLNRGPLLLREFPEEQSIKSSLGILKVLLREARRRRWWVVQIAPELPDNEMVRIGLQRLGLRRQQGLPWASGRLALSADEQVLLMGFKGKWRNCLRKGERLGVQVTHHEGSGVELELLISNYIKFQRNKGFEGIPETLLRSLSVQRGPTWQFNLFVARSTNAQVSDDQIGMLVSARHGDTTTYLIGASNEAGRQMQANSVLLWQAILHAKRTGCAWFDIGGLNAATPKGIAGFKQGLNAIPYALTGEWRWYFSLRP